MEGVAFCASQLGEKQAIIVFHVPDGRFDSPSSPNIPTQPRGDPVPEFAVIDLNPDRASCTALAQIDKYFLRLPLCQDCSIASLAVVRIARQAALMPTTEPSLCVVATAPFTPDS